MGHVLDFLLELVFPYLLLPVLWIVVAPFILIASFFSKAPYAEVIERRFTKVTRWWLALCSRERRRKFL